MKHYLFLILATFLLNSVVFAGVKEGIAAMERGDYEAAYKEFLPLAEKGDDVAMITIGTFYYEGKGVKQDYALAMEWYVKAFKKENGDAYNNIGVMYRDGKGVEKNKKIAYSLFMITHVTSLGSESTQTRTNNNLRKIIPEMTSAETKEVFDYTVEYIKAYVESNGKLKGIPKEFLPSKERLSLKDKPWWMKGELDFLKTIDEEIKKEEEAKKKEDENKKSEKKEKK